MRVLNLLVWSCSFAIKILDKTHSDFDLESLEKEVMILKKVSAEVLPSSYFPMSKVPSWFQLFGID